MSEPNNDQDNQKFAMMMYIVMFLIGAGILGYGAATGQLKDWMQNKKAEPAAATDPPATAPE